MGNKEILYRNMQEKLKALDYFSLQNQISRLNIPLEISSR